MSGLSDQDWETFLNSEDEEPEGESSSNESATPFAVSDNEAAVDPLVFVQSAEAPELRFQGVTGHKTVETESSVFVEKPYFARQDGQELNPWVPKTNVEPDNTIEEVVDQATGATTIILRLILFAAPLLIIGFSFIVALSTE